MATLSSIGELLGLSPVIPVVTLEEVAIAPDLARALARGGVRVIDAAALAAIEAIGVYAGLRQHLLRYAA
jgi:2-keto-3-deoxy-6-phosphogluconate aldolase